MKSAASWRPQLFAVQPNSDFTNFSALKFSPDGKLLVVGNSDDVQMWDVTTQHILWKNQGACPIFSPDSRTVVLEHPTSVTGWEMRRFGGEHFELHDAQNGRLLHVLSDLSAKHKPDWGGDLCDCAFSPDGREFRVASIMWLWRFDVQSGRLIKTQRWSPLKNGDELGMAAFALDGTIVGWYDGDGACQKGCVNFAFFNPRTAQQLRRYHHEFSGGNLQIAPDSISSIEIARDEKSENILFRLQDGQPIVHLSDGEAQFSNDGKRVYVVSKRGCLIFDAHTGRKLTTLSGPMSEDFAPSPDDNWLYEARDGKIYRWRTR